MSDDFLLGFVAGFGTAGVVGFTVTWIRAGRRSMNAFFKPQEVKLKTDKSPSDVFGSCFVALVTFVLVTVILAVAGLMVFRQLQ